jgi:hypothetical protein
VDGASAEGSGGAGGGRQWRAAARVGTSARRAGGERHRWILHF